AISIPSWSVITGFVIEKSSQTPTSIKLSGCSPIEDKYSVLLQVIKKKALKRSTITRGLFRFIRVIICFNCKSIILLNKVLTFQQGELHLVLRGEKVVDVWQTKGE